jgi:RNA polymerase sigma-70 factor (ECF subfamily)
LDARTRPIARFCSNPVMPEVRKEEEMELALPLPAQPAADPVAARLEDASDGDLLGRIARRDAAAFELLYKRYARPVYGLAVRLLGDRGRAEDAVQETFTSIWRSASRYRPERGPGAPWLYAIARNAIVDRARARRDSLAEHPDGPSREPGPPEHAEQAELSWQVHRALAELPDHERSVLELAYWSGLSQSEIASFLDLPLGTVKTRTRSGLARLAGLLDGELR